MNCINLSKPKDDETKNDAMVNLYPLECPKPIAPVEVPLWNMKSQTNLSDPIHWQTLE